MVGKRAALGEAFHITSDEALPWTKIYAETAAAAGNPTPEIVKIPLEFICERFPKLIGPLKGDKANPAIFDNAKLKRFVPEFRCRKSFHDGIRESVAWMRAHPEDRKINAQADATFDAVIAAWRRESGTA